jgi:hypothetical protein
MKRSIIISVIILCAAWSYGQSNASKKSLTETLEYVSAVYDPISEETQVEFKTAANEKRIFYYTKNDVLKLEEQFFNLPVQPITEAGKNLTKNELVGKKYEVSYLALTEHSTTTCCFKMQSCTASK